MWMGNDVFVGGRVGELGSIELKFLILFHREIMGKMYPEMEIL